MMDDNHEAHEDQHKNEPQYFSEQSKHLRDYYKEKDLWIFGYGSLVWKTNFPKPFVEQAVGKIQGYKRRFWQASTDHRGVPGNPGRVVTMVEDQESFVWGVAYKIGKDDVAEVLDYLDHREKGGYECCHSQFSPKDSDGSFEVMFYVGTPDNAAFLGPKPLEDIAHQIANSVGPSGRNDEYLFHLADGLRKFATEEEIQDNHLFQLDKMVREIKAKET